jgi:hypothetical protein
MYTQTPTELLIMSVLQLTPLILESRIDDGKCFDFTLRHFLKHQTTKMAGLPFY